MHKIISFESTCEGAGKTTQINILSRVLTSLQVPYEKFKFPDNKFRDLLLRGDIFGSKSHMLLQHAEFAQTLEHKIKPALEAGKWVILDRWIDSSYAYQGFGSGIDIGEINRSLEFAIGEYKPMITILLDIDPAEASNRVKQRRGTARVAEREGEEFSKRVREGFLSMADKFSHRIKLIDASGTEGDVFLRVKHELPLFDYGKKEES